MTVLWQGFLCCYGVTAALLFCEWLAEELMGDVDVAWGLVPGIRIVWIAIFAIIYPIHIASSIVPLVAELYRRLRRTP